MNIFMLGRVQPQFHFIPGCFRSQEEEACYWVTKFKYLLSHVMFCEHYYVGYGSITGCGGWHVNHLSANPISSPSSEMLSACHLSIVYTGYGGGSSLITLAIFKCMT